MKFVSDGKIMVETPLMMKALGKYKLELSAYGPPGEERKFHRVEIHRLTIPCGTSYHKEIASALETYDFYVDFMQRELLREKMGEFRLIRV